MRRVVKAELSAEVELKLCADSTLVALKHICKTKDKSKITESIYREPYETEHERKSRVADKLADYYLYKCAYCECLETVDIEHYRPKKAVAGDEEHEGYYWLCYEWTNLIPACVKCNREGGKHCKFPIAGVRVWTQPKLIDGKLDFAKFKAGASPLIDEKPHLLHPEVDFPEQHFEFEVDSENKGISIKAIDNNLRGEQTIAICKLNRESLRLRRQKNVIKDAVIGLNVAYASHIHQQQDCNIAALFTSLESAIHTLKIKGSDIDNEHTLLRQYIIKSSKNFMKMIAPFVLQIPHNQLAFAAQRTLD